jgi:hypothetical protein
MTMMGRVLTVVSIIVVLMLLFNGWRNCTRSGGRYVRGVFFMECIR